MDSVSSCPLAVSWYSTLGGISLKACLCRMPFLSSSFSLIARVLLLNPFIVFLNFRYLTDSVEQHNGNRILSVPLFVINFLKEDVSFIRASTSYPLKLQELSSLLIIGNLVTLSLDKLFLLMALEPFCLPDFTYFTDLLLPLQIVYIVNLFMSNDNKIKEKIKERYGKIAVFGNSESCCMPSSECCSGDENSGASTIQSIKAIGYNQTELASIPQSSILGVGCGNPTKFAHINDGDVVVDLGSGAGIDA